MKSESEIKNEILKLYKVAKANLFRSDECYKTIEILEWVLK